MRNFLNIIGVVLIGVLNKISATSFAKTYGGANEDFCYSVKQTNDGGYIAAGYTTSFGTGYEDFLIIKLSSIGNLEWAKTFGKQYGYREIAYSIQETNDGGYIVAGYTDSFDGEGDFLIIKLFSNGNIEWVKTLGGNSVEEAYSIQETNDGGYIIAGYTNSFGAGLEDFLIVKLSSNGTLEWAKTFGGIYQDYALSIQQTNDGGYIVAGYTNSFTAGEGDFLVIKLSSTGEMEWAKIFGGQDEDGAFFVQQTNDGGYIVAGATFSFSVNWVDFLIIKLSPTASIEWAKTFSVGSYNYALSIQQTDDGGYIVTGVRYANSGDFLVIKLSSTGNIEWKKIFDGGSNDIARSVEQTNDGGYIIAGRTNSFGAGNYDFLIVKTQDGQMASDCPWYEATNLITLSPYVISSFTSPMVTSPNLIIHSPSITVLSPSILTYDVCSQSCQELPSLGEDNPKVSYFSFDKDKISLMFSGYFGEKIKIILYDILGKEIISKSYKFSPYLQIKEEKIEKLSKGIYFLKIYSNGKEIGRFKMIKK